MASRTTPTTRPRTRPRISATQHAPTASPRLFAPATAEAPPKVCVIAEIGVNHDGRLDRAIELVNAAADAGADAVKTQLFDPRLLLSNQAKLAVYQESSADDVFDMLDGLKLGLDELLAVRAAARKRGVAFIVTPFSLENFDTLAALDVDAVKIASPDVVNTPLLRRVASLTRPMLISTGTAELDELAFAAELIRTLPVPGAQDDAPAPRGCLMQCVSSYPTPNHEAALGAIPVIARRFGLPVGYSDHTTDILTGALAVAAGAAVIEKHLTYDRHAKGPDHAASFEPAEFARYVAMIRQAAAMLGETRKAPRGVEADVRFVSRQSLCAVRDLPAGHVLREQDLTVKRPGSGIPAARFDAVVGSRLTRAVKQNNLLTPDDIDATKSR